MIITDIGFITKMKLSEFKKECCALCIFLCCAIHLPAQTYTYNGKVVKKPPKANNNKSKPNNVSKEKVFDAVEQMPSYPGGQRALLSYLSSHVKYPAIAEQNSIQGRAVVGFIIETDGTISGVSILQSAGDPSLDQEAVRVINNMPHWEPGRLNGQVVRVRYQVPISFSLQ